MSRTAVRERGFGINGGEPWIPFSRQRAVKAFPLNPVCTRVLRPLPAWKRHGQVGFELPWVAYLL
jgi:hypothetical protein